MTFIFRIAVLAALLQAGASTQPGTASVEGIVVKRETGQPLAGAVVELTGLAAPAEGRTQARDWRVLSFSAITAGDGTFRIEGVPPGDAWQLVATHPDGFVPAAHSQTTAGEPWTPLPLARGQRVTGIRLALVELASISGRVVDDDGDPVRNMPVKALAIHYLDGHRILRDGGLDYTDNTGSYRITGLAPGRYAVRTGPEKGVGADIAPYKYFPGSSLPDDFAVIELAERSHIDSVDFVATNIRTRRVRGIVIGPDGNRAEQAGVFLVPPGAIPDSNAAQALTAADGEFEFRGVAPGRYHLFAIAERGNGTSSGRIELEISTFNIGGLLVPLRPDIDVQGHIRVEPPAPGFDFTQVLVSAFSQTRITADLSIHAGLAHDNVPRPAIPMIDIMPDAGGTFTLRGVRAWPYRLDAVVKDEPRIYLKSVGAGARDILNRGEPSLLERSAPLDIVLGSDGATLEGSVVDSAGNGAANAVAVLVPDEPFRYRRDLYRVTQTDPSGHFYMQAIAPGSYSVFAWRGASEGAWFFPEFLRPHESRAPHIVIYPLEAGTVEAPLLTTPDPTQ